MNTMCFSSFSLELHLFRIFFRHVHLCFGHGNSRIPSETIKCRLRGALLPSAIIILAKEYVVGSLSKILRVLVYEPSIL